MAIEAWQLPYIEWIARGELPSRLCVCLGYPDILVPNDAYPDVPIGSHKAAAWHNWRGKVIDSDAYFKLNNLQPRYHDRAAVRGPEHVVDLNEPGQAEFGLSGLIIDPGTSEHVFNVGELMRRIVEGIGVGGYVMHTNPLNMGNHGFWSFNPTAYKDFYEANGCTIETMKIFYGPLHGRDFIDSPDQTGRFDAPNNSSLFVVARKADRVPFAWPVQTKYRNNPRLGG